MKTVASGETPSEQIQIRHRPVRLSADEVARLMHHIRPEDYWDAREVRVAARMVAETEGSSDPHFWLKLEADLLGGRTLLTMMWAKRSEVEAIDSLLHSYAQGYGFQLIRIEEKGELCHTIGL